MSRKSIDLEALAKKLDISPTMHKYAVDRYDGIAKHLKAHGIDASIYPQGSFRTGTVVRPLKDNVESDFDIDVVCELNLKKGDTSPEYVKVSVGKILALDETYRQKLSPEQDRCWTLIYAEVADGIGLKLDVVPCAGEGDSSILLLKTKGVLNEYADKAVVITEKYATTQYKWIASNPAGYGDWFDNINRRFLEDNLTERKQAFLNENRVLFASDTRIEDVPDFYIKSSLQRVIQLLKRHRDIYYSRIKDGEKLRPISAIITTLAAKIAMSASLTDLQMLLTHVVSGLMDYSSLLQGRSPVVRYFGEVRNYIEKKDQKWSICNPVNPDDNYADTWTDDTARAFFGWVAAVNNDLANTSPDDGTKYLVGLKSGLGSSFVEGILTHASASVSSNSSRPITTPTKPWGLE